MAMRFGLAGGRMVSAYIPAAIQVQMGIFQGEIYFQCIRYFLFTCKEFQVWFYVMSSCYYLVAGLWQARVHSHVAF
jgi:hypothetical protein